MAETPPAQTTEIVSDSNRWNALQTKLHEAKLVRAFELFRAGGLEPILIKGWAAARFYPSGKFRSIGDIDLCFSSGDFPRALELSKTDEIAALFVDIHEEFRQLDRVRWDDIFARSQLITHGDTGIRIPCPEDHLRILCIHWLTDGGQYREKLDDIYYAIEKRPADFDWDLCLNSVSSTRRNWIITAVAIAHRFRGLQVDDLPFASEVRVLPAWVEKTIEAEWASDVKLEPVLAQLSQFGELRRQIGKRIPPNPIRSTIEMEQPFTSRKPRKLQAAILARRTVNLLRNMPGAVVSLLKYYVQRSRG